MPDSSRTHSHYRIITRNPRTRKWQYLAFSGSAAINEPDRIKARLAKARLEWPEAEFAIQVQTVRTVKSEWRHL